MKSDKEFMELIYSDYVNVNFSIKYDWENTDEKEMPSVIINSSIDDMIEYICKKMNLEYNSEWAPEYIENPSKELFTIEGNKVDFEERDKIFLISKTVKGLFKKTMTTFKEYWKDKYKDIKITKSEKFAREAINKVVLAGQKAYIELENKIVKMQEEQARKEAKIAKMQEEQAKMQENLAKMQEEQARKEAKMQEEKARKEAKMQAEIDELKKQLSSNKGGR